MSGALDWSRDGAHWPHRQASRFVEAGGCRWHVQVHVQARVQEHVQERVQVHVQPRVQEPAQTAAAVPSQPVVWLLHGTGAASHSWRGLVPLLAPHATLVVPDLPGHGFSSAMARTSLPGMARALAALAATLGLAPTLVVGHSAGAALALRAVLDGLLAPQQLVGINAALLPFDGLAGKVFAPMARLMASQAWVPALLARRASDASAVQRLVRATGSTLDAPGLALYARLMRCPAHVAGALAMMADWDLPGLWRDLPALRTPLALLVGAQDGTVPPSQAQRVRLRLPATRVQVLAGLGHLAHEEAPQRLLQALLAWLAVAAAAALPQRAG